VRESVGGGVGGGANGGWKGLRKRVGIERNKDRTRGDIRGVQCERGWIRDERWVQKFHGVTNGSETAVYPSS